VKKESATPDGYIKCDRVVFLLLFLLKILLYCNYDLPNFRFRVKYKYSQKNINLEKIK